MLICLLIESLSQNERWTSFKTVSPADAIIYLPCTYGRGGVVCLISLLERPSNQNGSNLNNSLKGTETGSWILRKEEMLV